MPNTNLPRPEDLNLDTETDITSDTTEEPVTVQRTLTGYHTRFAAEQFPEGLIEATRQLMTKIWRQPKEVRREGIETWLRTASELYNVPVPTFDIIQGDAGRIMYMRTGGGQYFPDEQKIVLYKKHSLTTLIHEFRHHLQYCVRYNGDLEEDARGYSCSLYYLSDSERYMRAATEGKLWFA
jgi:hypothetical protein